MRTRTIVVFVGIVILAGIGGALYYRAASKPKYQLATVTQSSITQEVLASGNVQSPTTTDLHFQTSGTMTALNVSVNQQVSAGEVLAQQDTSILDAQLAQAKAAVAGATATLQKLESGATPQTIAVSNAALTTAQQGLQNSYATVPTTLADAYAKANDAVTSQLALLFSNAQTATPQLTFTTSDSQVESNAVAERVQAGTELAVWQSQLADVQSSLNTSSLDQMLAQADAHLAPIQSLLSAAVTAVTDSTGLSSVNATAYRASASSGLTETNAAITEVRALEQTIASQKAAIAQAQAQLTLTSASSTGNDIAVAQAGVAQAQANVAVIEAQIKDLEIIAPSDGVVTATNGNVGEVITPDVPVVSIMPQGVLEVKVNVSEDNIVGVALGQLARIELDAFPIGTEFMGAVSEIDPAQTVIGGAIYYQTTLLFSQQYQGVKPGMTANVWIDTGFATSTLIVPASALSQNGASTSVQVYQNGTMTTVPVTTGLKDQNGNVEITDGLSQGEQIVTGSN